MSKINLGVYSTYVMNMCKNCKNNEMCMGTGCRPRNELLGICLLIDDYVKEHDDNLYGKLCETISKNNI